MNLSGVNRILFIHAWGIGDVLLTIAAVRTLKMAFPKAHLTYITGAHANDVLLNNPDIDEVLIYDSSVLRLVASKPEYDLAISFHFDKRSQAITLVSGAKYRVGNMAIKKEDRKTGLLNPYNVYFDCPRGSNLDYLDYILHATRALGLKDASKETHLFLTSEENNFAESFWEGAALTGAERVVGLHPGGRLLERLWAVKDYAQVADELMAHSGCRIVVFQGPGERETAESVCREMHNQALLVALLEIRKYSALVKKCNLLITTDGGPLHIAAALGVNLLGIFRDKDSADGYFVYRDKKNYFHLVESSSIKISPIDLANAALKLISTYK